MAESVDLQLERAARAVAGADALLIAAGAGMGVDSGLPDFRGTEGFWRAYPPLAELGLRFEEVANPAWFERDPQLAWGFYGHRLNLYRSTEPHEGFAILRRWAEAKPGGYFVFTSNVDGQFQRAGFGESCVVECHGSIHHFQCTRVCNAGVWPATEVRVYLTKDSGGPLAPSPGTPGEGWGGGDSSSIPDPQSKFRDAEGPHPCPPPEYREREQCLGVDESTMRAAGDLPACPACGALARPNVLMFGDARWEERRTADQVHRYHAWLRAARGARLAVVECGAGTAVPTVRLESERVAARHGATLVRVNVREPQVPPGEHVGVPLRARDALAALDRLGI